MASPRNGILHQYTSTLSAFEHIPNKSSFSAQNLIIFIGGLFDGLGTVPYVTYLSDSLPNSWSLTQVVLSSSYKGWGTSSLQNDVQELSKCIEYFRRIKKGLFVLLGHSTGCQDIMEYLTGPGHKIRASIDGVILQAPVSDREIICVSLSPSIYAQACLDAQKMIDADHGDKILSTHKDIENLFPCPLSAYRWLSLASPNKDGDDDYFSSDLTLEQLRNSFGKLDTPLCIFISGADEYMPESINKEALLAQWVKVIENGQGKYDSKHSSILEGASHNLSKNGKEIVDKFVERVVGFLGSLPA